MTMKRGGRLLAMKKGEEEKAEEENEKYAGGR